MTTQTAPSAASPALRAEPALITGDGKANGGGRRDEHESPNAPAGTAKGGDTSGQTLSRGPNALTGAEGASGNKTAVADNNQAHPTGRTTIHLCPTHPLGHVNAIALASRLPPLPTAGTTSSAHLGNNGSPPNKHNPTLLTRALGDAHAPATGTDEAGYTTPAGPGNTLRALSSGAEGEPLGGGPRKSPRGLQTTAVYCGALPEQLYVPPCLPQDGKACNPAENGVVNPNTTIVTDAQSCWSNGAVVLIGVRLEETTTVRSCSESG